MITKDSVFCLVENGTILKYNVSQKKTGLGVKSSIELYNGRGYYLLVDSPLIPSSTQTVSSVYEVDEENKVVNKVYTIASKGLEALKQTKINLVKASTVSDTPVVCDDITYNGGVESANAINGAIQLAQLNGEETLDIWDLNDVVRNFTIPDALVICKDIGLPYRTVMLARQAKIALITAIVVDAEGTYPTYDEAVIALQAITI